MRFANTRRELPCRWCVCAGIRQPRFRSAAGDTPTGSPCGHPICLEERIQAMPEHNLIQACLDEFDHFADAGDDDEFAGEYFPALLATSDMASELVAELTRTADPNWRARLALFRTLLERARLDAEGRCRLGERFLREVFAALDALAAGGGLAEDPAVRLAYAFTRAGIEVPQSLVTVLARRLEEQAISGRLREHIDAAIDRLERNAEHDDGVVHDALDVLLRVLPPEFGSMCLDHVSIRDSQLCARLIVYCLLHPSREIRLRAACSLEDRARSGLLEPAMLATLALVRSWVPADSARETLDETLRTALREEQFRPPEPEARHFEQLQATFPTGSGQQVAFAALEGEEGLAVATVLLDARRGITGAFVVKDSEAGNEEPALATGTEMSEERKEAFELMLCAALADGLSAGVSPPAGLIEVALACGLTELRPYPMNARAWLASVDPAGEIASLPEPVRERLIGRSALWPADHEELATWFEGTKEFDEAVKSTSGMREAEAVFWERLEERRDEWALLMLRAALVLKASRDDDEWRSFAATASAVLDGRDLHKVPIMVYIVSTTIEAWQRENDVLAASDRTTAWGFPAPDAAAARASRFV